MYILTTLLCYSKKKQLSKTIIINFLEDGLKCCDLHVCSFQHYRLTCTVLNSIMHVEELN